MAGGTIHVELELDVEDVDDLVALIERHPAVRTVDVWLERADQVTTADLEERARRLAGARARAHQGRRRRADIDE